jgi:uncharacterized protein YjbI with pentapeptide repeats
VVGYDGGWNVRDEEFSVWQTKPEREQKEETKQSRWGFRGMTVRNWLELLIVPLVLVGIGLLFEMQQADRQLATELQQQTLEERRAKAEQELAEQRAQDEALQAYLDQMSLLMLDRKLLEAEEGDPVYTLAQARTSTAILRLDAEHNESVTRFLTNSGLAGKSVSESSISLFREIDLRKANLSGAELSNTNLSGADLRKANLSGASLANANLNGADLRKANLSNAFLPAANLDNANLNGAEGITNEELTRLARSLEGARMPNGRKYGEWLKDS